MCKEAVDDCLGGLKFIPDCFVTNKMIERFLDALSANDDIMIYSFLIKTFMKSHFLLIKWIFLL